MAEPSRRYAYNNNRLFIEEINDSPTQQLTNLNTNNRQILPAIRDATPVNNTSRINQSNLNASLDLNNTQNKLKQLENRVQVTEVSNRALLEEVIRLQNELASNLRRSFDTIAEERTARQILENNFKFQSDNYLQVIGRLKRNEDSLAEDRTAMQSLIVYTKNLEQSILNAQKDLFSRRDYQAQRLEDLKLQIDNLQYSKENLERSASVLLEEIKSLKNKVDLETINLNSISGDLRNKTRRLEDENRQQMDVMRKHHDTMALTENNLTSVKSLLENKISEVRDMNTDLKNQIEREREEKRNYEQQLNLRFNELNSLINEEKLKYNESIRVLESFKREFYQSVDSERLRLNSVISDSKDSTLLIANDKLEKVKEDVLNKLRDYERLISEESEKRTKFQQSIKDSTDLRVDSLKRSFEEEILLHRNETRESSSKTAESIKKLNEGLNLIELQNEERGRKMEQVISAEIKARKVSEKDIMEKVDNYNEKFTYAMQSFQTTIGNLGTRLNDAKEQFVNRKDFESYEKKQETLQSDLLKSNTEISQLKENLKTNSNQLEQQINKLKEVNETIYKLENVTVPSLNTKLGQLPTREDLNNLKTEYEEKINDEIQKIIKQNDSNHSEMKKSTDDKLNEFNAQINNFGTKFNQKINSTEKLVKDQIALQNEYQLKNMTTLRDDLKKSIKESQELNEKDLNEVQNRLELFRNETQRNNSESNQKINSLEDEFNGKITQINSNISTWKGNINGVIEAIKKDQESLDREQNGLDLKTKTLRDDQKKIQDDLKIKEAEINKLKSDVQRVEKNLNIQKDTGDIKEQLDSFEHEINELKHSLALNKQLIEDKTKTEQENRQNEINIIWNHLQNTDDKKVKQKLVLEEFPKPNRIEKYLTFKESERLIQSRNSQVFISSSKADISDTDTSFNSSLDSLSSRKPSKINLFVDT